jgi:hypothetical protein
MNEINKVVEQGYNQIVKDYYTHRDLKKFNTELEDL